MKTAYHSAKLGPHLIKWCVFIIQTFEKLRILTRLNSPWQRLTMGMAYRLDHHCTNFFFLFSLSVLTITELSQESKISVWSAFLHAWPQKSHWPKRSLFHKSRMGVAGQVQNTTKVTAFFAANWKNWKLKNWKKMRTNIHFNVSAQPAHTPKNVFDFRVTSALWSP